VVPSLPGLDQHEEVTEEGRTGGHTYEHLAEVDEDGRLEDGVGHEVLKLKPELLQQQQKEGRDQKCLPTGDVGSEQYELLSGKIAEGSSADTDSSGEPRRAPPKQVAHQVKHFLKLKAVRVTKRSHGVCDGASGEHEGKGAQAIGREWEKVTAVRGVNPFSRKPESLLGKPFRAPLNRRRKSRPTGTKDQGNPVCDMGAWVHKSYGLCTGLRVRKEQTAACAPIVRLLGAIAEDKPSL
jgi:hypothetical protein